MISSVGLPIQTYLTEKLSSTTTAHSGKSTPLTSETYSGDDHSKVKPLRERFVQQIDSVAGNTEDAERLLRDYSKPDSGGLFYAVGSDLNTINTDMSRRVDRISQLFNAENANVENQKSKMIAEGRAIGKMPQDILNDIVSLYDSQSELFKLGKGWDGEIFAFDSSSPTGYAHIKKYTSDVIDIKA
jgi:hypothetical protein